MAATAAMTSCGGDAESEGPAVVHHITRDFGQQVIDADDSAELPKPPTVMRLLREREDVKTIFDGKIVESIDGLKHVIDGEQPTRWLLYVNGIRSDDVPIGYRLRPGDRVQWDFREWTPVLAVRATIGAFPETFTRETFGKRMSLTVACEDEASAPCRRVKGKLREARVRFENAEAGQVPPRDKDQAQILVGTWDHWRDKRVVERLDDDVSESDVFARFSRGGDELQLLEPFGDSVRTVGAGTGLIAPIKKFVDPLLWVVTGVDEEGVDRASRAFGGSDMVDAYAVAVTEDGVVKLPVRDGG